MAAFNSQCRRCPRLAGYLDEVKAEYPDYHCQPVAAFGVAKPALFIVGLAPGLHGANATGRPFTGDASGIMLYETLYEFGYSNKAQSLHLNDGFKLKHCRITNAVKCLPPQNKPTAEEIKTCSTYLLAEIKALKPKTVIMALGSIAHESILRALGLKKRDFPFGHANVHALPRDMWLVDSYHCSRYNTQTKRLTPAMFHSIFEIIADLTPDSAPNLTP